MAKTTIGACCFACGERSPGIQATLQHMLGLADATNIDIVSFGVGELLLDGTTRSANPHMRAAAARMYGMDHLDGHVSLHVTQVDISAMALIFVPKDDIKATLVETYGVPEDKVIVLVNADGTSITNPYDHRDHEALAEIICTATLGEIFFALMPHCNLLEKFMNTN